MVRIGSIDPALCNVGFAILDTETSQIVHLAKVNLLKPLSLPGKSFVFKRALIPTLARFFVEDRIDLLKSCDVIVFENQMSARFIMMQMCWETILMEYCPCIVIHPSCVKKHFNTSKKDYALNKVAAVECCQSILSKENWSLIEQFPAKKRDDVADAVLQAFYTMDNYDDLIKKHNKPLSATPEGHKKRKRIRRLLNKRDKTRTSKRKKSS